MNSLTRREFISRSAAGIAGASVLAPQWLRSQPENKMFVPGPIGFQSWTIREELVKDLSGTLKMMAGLGYQSVEMCSPPGYANSGFGPLQKLKASEMKKIINDAGITCTSCHYGFDELKNNGQERMDFATFDAKSVLRATVAGASGSAIEVQIPTITGRTYRVECCYDLAVGTWLTLRDNIAGTGGVVAVPDPGAAAHPKCFYRVVTVQPVAQ